MSPRGSEERFSKLALAKALLQLFAVLLTVVVLEALVRQALGQGPPRSTFEFGF